MPIIERMYPSGGWIVTDIINGQLEKRRYFGYTEKEALQEFNEEFNTHA